VLGPGKPVVLLVVALALFYIVISAPRRLLDRSRASLAKESVLLAAAATACLKVTGSRSRTILLVKSNDPTVSAVLSEMGRKALLGSRPQETVAAASRNLPSSSAAMTLRKLALSRGTEYDPGDEESRGLSRSSELSGETKLPILMTACFFSPIMLLLYAVFSKAYSPQSLAELVAFEFIILDLTAYMGSWERPAK
jgi:hypothetical protein